MDFSPRHLPWRLALVGAVHGWVTVYTDAPICSRFQGDDYTAAILLALGFGAAFFLAGWLHVKRRATHSRDLPIAAAKILLCCGALGLIPALVLGHHTMDAAVPGVTSAIVIGIVALPSALLLVHAHGALDEPRPGSLFAGSDRAEEVLYTLGAMAMLPWYMSPRPGAAALMLALVALPALVIGLQAAILGKQTALLAEAFPNDAGASPRGATIVCDIGFGLDEREAPTISPGTYRSNASRPRIACRGSVERGSRAAEDLLCLTFTVVLVTGAQAAWLLLGRA